MISFSKEPFQVVEDNFHLIKEHWDEVVTDNRPLEPFWEIFRDFEKKDKLVCFTARKDGDLVGYAVFIFVPDLHSRNTQTAYNDAVFLKKEFRKGGLGKTFIEYCDEQMDKMNIDLILWHVKPTVDFSGLLKSIGYKHFNTLYAREVRG
jgi:GNAT superfamily N-acetyltransferase